MLSTSLIFHLNWSLTWGEGSPALCCILPLPHWPICCNESGKFLIQFLPSHTLWDGHKELKYSGKQPQSQCSCIYYEATDTLGGLLFKIWSNNRFFFLKIEGGLRRIRQIFILRSDRLENSIKMTVMARFIYNL